MKLIALSGGIASGKSTIAHRLCELGAYHVDADQLARDAVAPGSTGLAKIRSRFGAQVIAADGSLDREALAQQIFADDAARADLNAIVHPEVRRLAAARIAGIAEADPRAIIIYEVPLLVEAGVALAWDRVVIAEAPEATRVERMVRLRGMSEAEARARIAAQAADDERRAVADVIIDTGKSLEHTYAQVDAFWRELSARE